MVCSSLVRSSTIKALLGSAVFAIAIQSTALAQSNPTPLTDRLLERGIYGTGVVTTVVMDMSRTTPAKGSCPQSPYRKLVTEVWYPAEDSSLTEGRNAQPAAIEKYPLIVFAHGLASTRTEAKYLGIHLSSHGYIVAAPDFPLSNSAAPCGATSDDITGQVGDVIYLTQAIGYFLARSNGTVGGQVAAQIDMTRTALIGYSLGGTTAILAADYAPTYQAVATLAPSACPVFLPQPAPWEAPELTMPNLVLHGSTDAVIQFNLNAVPLYQNGHDPKYMVNIANGSHTGFLGDSGYYIESTAASYHMPMDSLICSYLPFSTDPTSPTAICKVCNPPYPLGGPQIAVARQQALTKATLLAFFDGYLRCMSLDLAYLQHIADRENSELTVSFSGSPSKGQAHCAAR